MAWCSEFMLERVESYFVLVHLLVELYQMLISETPIQRHAMYIYRHPRFVPKKTSEQKVSM
jgi:hypothetical protein